MYVIFLRSDSGCDLSSLFQLSHSLCHVQGNTVSVSSLTGGSSDNTGAGIARRIGILLLEISQYRHYSRLT